MSMAIHSVNIYCIPNYTQTPEMQKYLAVCILKKTYGISIKTEK